MPKLDYIESVIGIIIFLYQHWVETMAALNPDCAVEKVDQQNF
jgi:hypothetical protein